MKKAIIYGAGNIGRGFIGQLFSSSGYETVFIDLEISVIERLNLIGSYPIYITDGDRYREARVENVRGINGRDKRAAAEEIADAYIMATAVGVGALKAIAEPIAMGIKLRMEKNIQRHLNIIVCENMIGADSFLSSAIRDLLEGEEKAYFDRYVATVEPSIGRMVPKTPAHISEKEPLAICVEPYCELPVDRDGFKGEIPEIVNMVPFSPFDFHIRRKLFMHNMSHALTAYLGYLKGYEYIYQAAEDEEICKTASAALEEVSLALSKEYGVPQSSLQSFSSELLERYRNRLLLDTVERVGKDSVRKLGENDRFVGAILLCQKHGIEPANILKGLAAGLLFAPEGDESSAKLSADAKEKGVRYALKAYCSIENEDIIRTVVDFSGIAE